ncbi:MAG: oligosaccharide flippase family protein [Oscillospiraceae bacterium]
MAESRKQNYLTGAAILAATVAITKVIGAIYKIPLYNLLGDEGSAHFQVMYNIYNLLLTIATAGVPLAISRLISASRAVGKYGQAKRYYSVGMMVFGVIGIVGMLIMLLFAQPLADFMNDHEVAGGVRVLAPAVFFACIISVYRGYSQGHNDMIPTAISQIMEVLCKLIFGLAIAWYLSSTGYGSAAVAAGAIVGVTIGLGLSVPIMAAYKRRIAARYAGENVLDTPDTRLRTCKQILKVSIPITLGSSVLNIITLIDSKLVLGRLQTGAGFSYTDAKVLYGVYSKGLTLFNVPSSFITPVVVAVVPVIAAAIAKKHRTEAKNTMESCMRITNLLAMPAGVGLCVLSEPIFNVLYPNSNENGPLLLALLGIASYFVCTYIITNGILQASGHEKLALISLPIGGVIKICVNYWLVGTPSINIVGAPIGTLVCYVIITLINVVFISVKLPAKPNFLKITVRPLICTAVMGAAAGAVYGLLDKFLNPLLGGGRLGLLVCLVGAIAVAVIIYLVLIIALRAVTRDDILLLPKGEKLAKLLKIQ